MKLSLPRVHPAWVTCTYAITYHYAGKGDTPHFLMLLVQKGTQAGLEASRPAGAYAFGPHIAMRFFGARYIPLPSVMPNLS